MASETHNNIIYHPPLNFGALPISTAIKKVFYFPAKSRTLNLAAQYFRNPWYKFNLLMVAFIFIEFLLILNQTFF